MDTWNRSKPKAQNPEKTRKHLQGWLPREHWWVCFLFLYFLCTFLFVYFVFFFFFSVSQDAHKIAVSEAATYPKSPMLNSAARPPFFRHFFFCFSPLARSEVNGLLVGFGQQVCFAVNPSCSTCGIRELCPSAERHGDLSSRPADTTP